MLQGMASGALKRHKNKSCEKIIMIYDALVNSHADGILCWYRAWVRSMLWRYAEELMEIESLLRVDNSGVCWNIGVYVISALSLCDNVRFKLILL